MNTNQMVLTEEKADLYDAALDHVNDVRNDLGLNPVTELQPGCVGESFQCPVSRTIIKGAEDQYSSSSWQHTTIYNIPGVTDGSGVIDPDGNVLDDSIVIDSAKMSDLSYSFQRAFDRGEFPELIAK